MSLGDLGLEFILGLGAALFAANAWVLLRPLVTRRRKGKPLPRPASTTRVVGYMVTGGVVAAWALATILSRR